LVEVEAHELLAAQASGEQDKDDRAVAPGAPSGPDGNRALGGNAPAGALVKAFEAVTEVLEGADLVVVEGPGLQGRQAEFADAFGRIAAVEAFGVLGVDPGGEGGEGGEEVVDGGRGAVLLVAQIALPGQDIAVEAGGDLVVAVARGEEVGKAPEVERDLGGDGGRAHTGDGELEVALAPGAKSVERGQFHRLNLS